MMILNNNSYQGQIAYLDDAFVVDLTGSATASSIASVDSRFTVTLAGITGTLSAYEIQVSNINPLVKVPTVASTGTGAFTSGGDGNKYPTPDNITYTANPDLEDSWVTVSPFDSAGYVIVDGYFRLMRIVNTGGFEAGAKAYVFAEKMSPVIS